MHLVERLIMDGHIVTLNSQQQEQMSTVGVGLEALRSSIGVIAEEKRRKIQIVCCITLARELFEFRNMDSAVSKAYVAALQNVLDHGVSSFSFYTINKIPRVLTRMMIISGQSGLRGVVHAHLFRFIHRRMSSAYSSGS